MEREAGLVCPADRDYADYIVEYLTDPAGTLARQRQLLKRVAELASGGDNSTPASLFESASLQQARAATGYG